jgi:hypothetical protein
MPNERGEQEHHSDQCGCDELEAQAQGATNCGGSITIPTLEEQHVLAQIRQLQQEALHVKQSIRRLENLPGAPEPSLADLREQLRVLRQRRSDLEDRRIRAAHERMRLLGHA